LKSIDLFESNVNSHINHIEELVIDQGKVGIQKAIDILSNVASLLTTAEPNATHISQKFDGISIVFGIDPEDKKFFVGTKSAFSLTPKVIKSEKDLQIHYGDEEDLADKLRTCLRYLRPLKITGILQGDLLFTTNTLQSENINGQDMIVFRPNTISYAVPEDSLLGKTITRASLGIAIHTSYHGELGNLIKDEMPRLGQIKSTPSVWIKPVTYDNYSAVQLSDAERQSLANDLDLIKGLVSTLKGGAIDKVLNHVRADLKSWVIQTVKNGEHIETSTSLKSFFTYVVQKNDLIIKSYKTQKAKDNKVDKLTDLKNFLITNRSTFESIIRIHILITKIKNKLLARLNTIEEIGTFIKTDNGYKVTNPEGFVAIGQDGDVVKLVDRLEGGFSQLNFLHGAPWKKSSHDQRS
jgi:hypothetical protein